MAVPAEQLLADLEGSFRARLAGAQRELADVTQAPGPSGYRVLRAFTSWEAIEEHTVGVIDGSSRHVYVSVNCPDPQGIAAALGRADGRGVVCDVLHFGEPIVELRHGRTVGHDSTRGVVYRRHQARHVAVVGDSADVVWAVAEDGADWQSVAGHDQLLAALAKGYIRHDFYVQQIWNEFPDVLAERWGPGMQQLVEELSARPPLREAHRRPRAPARPLGVTAWLPRAGASRAVSSTGTPRRTRGAGPAGIRRVPGARPDRALGRRRAARGGVRAGPRDRPARLPCHAGRALTPDPGAAVTDLCANDALTLAGMLRRREASAREVVTAHIDRIEALDGPVNAVVTRCFDRALARAAEADDALARGEVPGLLHGLPVAHKDLAETAGVRTTYGSPLFSGHVPDFDALVVERMSGAGAISLGKTNTPEFGAGSHTVNPVFGATRNPYDLSRSAGGSSGGAAAALAARMICLADGSDLGGSLRNPASFCNVVGLRPSPGRVPRWPPGDVADTFSVDGPMARTVADVALLLAVLSGPDPRVPFSLDTPAPVLAEPAQVVDLLARDMRGVKVAWSADLGLPLDPAVRSALAPARQVLVDLGCEVTDAAPDLSGADETFRAWRAFRFATAYAPLLREHRDQLGPNVAWNIERGLELTTGELSSATALRAALAERVGEFFATAEVLACPVSQVPPFDVTIDWVHEIDGVPQRTYLDWMASCYLISATGLPAISVPAGFTPDGLPVGLQLVGRWRADWPLLGVAHAFEAATGHAQRAPALPAPPGHTNHSSTPANSS